MKPYKQTFSRRNLPCNLLFHFLRVVVLAGKLKILSRDKLAYLLLLNGKDRHAWSSMLVDRMTAKMNTQDQGRRILFYKVQTLRLFGGGLGNHEYVKPSQAHPQCLWIWCTPLHGCQWEGQR